MLWRYGGALTRSHHRVLWPSAYSKSCSYRLFHQSLPSLPRNTLSRWQEDADQPRDVTSTPQHSIEENTSDAAETPDTINLHASDHPRPTVKRNRRTTGQKPTIDLRWLRRPYSYPEAKFDGLKSAQMEPLTKNSALADSPETLWYASQATRPLLLTFDAFDTLFTPRTPVPTQYCQAAAKWGFEFPEEAVEASFKKAFKKLSRQFPNYGKDKGIDCRTWWKRIIENTLLPLIPESRQPATVPAGLVDMLYEQFSSSQGYMLFPDVLPFLSLLGTSYQASEWAPARTMLGVLSNSDPRVREILASFHIDISPALYPPRETPHSPRFMQTFGPAHFAFATLSYECGHQKPSRMIFDAATRNAQSALDSLHPIAKLSRSGLRMFDSVRAEFHHMHVGNDLEEDVLPALKCGWDAVLLDRNEEQEISTREVGGQQIIVVNNLLALQSLATKERFKSEDGSAAQAPVWVDESRTIERTDPGRWPQWRKLKGRRKVPHPLSPPWFKLKTLR